jgi:hypothetical protein
VPRIIGLLSWYDESPTFLASCVASIAPHIDHLVAVDGAYIQFPDGKGRSDRTQPEVIEAICEGAGISCTIHRPAEPYYGNEVEKRSLLFKIAAAFAEPYQDWYWIIDADCIVTDCPPNLRDELVDAVEDGAYAADVVLWERRDYIGDVPDIARGMELPTESQQYLTCMFRVLRGMQVVGAHYVYGGFKEDGSFTYVWGPHFMGTEPRVQLPQIRVEHRSHYRDLYRKNLSKSYYKVRDELGIERVVPRDEKTQELEPIKVEPS